MRHGNDDSDDDSDDESNKDFKSLPPVPRPHHRYFNPNFASLRDIYNGHVMANVVPLEALALSSSSSSHDMLQQIRTFWKAFYPTRAKAAVSAWQQVLLANRHAKQQQDGNDSDDIVDDEIVQVTLTVPRRRNILQEWGFAHVLSRQEMPEGDLAVTLRMPLSVVLHGNNNVRLSSEAKNEFGCRTLVVESINLSLLDPNVPLVLYFHGGGLTAGTRDDCIALEMVQAAAATTAGEGKRLILASVGYSLAPKYKFPTQPAEALTVLSYLLEQSSTNSAQRRIHIWGISAGANLAAVAGLELLRRFPHRLGSLAAWIPMVDPAADSTSFYMNRNVQWVSPAWLRWCWRSYLGMPHVSDEEREILSLHTLAERLAHGSNQKAWAASPWRQNNLQRLVDPTLDVPPLHEAVSPISILTNRADPLYDDGIKLLQALEAQGANVTHVDHPGSHWLGTALDPNNYQELVHVWKDHIFAYNN